MRSETFTQDGITATVRSRSRRTIVIEAQYRQVLQKAFPEMVEEEQTVYLEVPPIRPSKMNAAMETQFNAEFAQYQARLSAIRNRFPVGAVYSDACTEVVPLLASITAIAGAPFQLNSEGRFPDEDVVTAFNHYLDDERGGFWGALYENAAKANSPLTSVEAKPPETLTEAERKDPLSEPPDNSSKKE